MRLFLCVTERRMIMRLCVMKLCLLLPLTWCKWTLIMPVTSIALNQIQYWMSWVYLGRSLLGHTACQLYPTLMKMWRRSARREGRRRSTTTEGTMMRERKWWVSSPHWGLAILFFWYKLGKNFLCKWLNSPLVFTIRILRIFSVLIYFSCDWCGDFCVISNTVTIWCADILY